MALGGMAPWEMLCKLCDYQRMKQRYFGNKIASFSVRDASHVSFRDLFQLIQARALPNVAGNVALPGSGIGGSRPQAFPAPHHYLYPSNY